MKERITQPQGHMLGRDVKNARSKTSRSSKCNDRERRSIKRADKAQLRLDVRSGRYNMLLK